MSNIDNFYKAVRQHNLYYSFSDNPADWDQGKKTWAEVFRLARYISSEDAAEIWNEYVLEKKGEPTYLMTVEQFEARRNEETS